MNPYVTEALAHARIEELHREAALRRRFASPRTTTARGAQALARLRTWTATHLVLARRNEPACCPA